MGTLSLDAVTSLGNGRYTVRSQSTASLEYAVDVKAGFCECNVGQNGALCKHQVACAEHSMTALPQVFAATSENRRWLASVAVGQENTPPETFLKGLLEPPPEVEAVGKTTVFPEEREEKTEPPQQVLKIKEKQCLAISEFVAAVQDATEMNIPWQLSPQL